MCALSGSPVEVARRGALATSGGVDVERDDYHILIIGSRVVCSSRDEVPGMGQPDPLESGSLGRTTTQVDGNVQEQSSMSDSQECGKTPTTLHHTEPLVA